MNTGKTGFTSGEPLPDRPGTDPERDDQLGYASFARQLARAITRITPTDGLVIALHGPWGSGKSTVLNFVQNYLARESRTDSGRPAVVRFNPWWFSDGEDLIRSFFDQLVAELKGTSTVVKRARSALQTLGPLVQTFVSATGHSVAAQALSAASSRGRKRPSVLKIKDKIAKVLSKASNKVLVIIDDIDRLSSSEVREVFRLIKSVADFPNVTYLLAFDRAAVCRMLDSVQEGLGEEYLGKIVQIPFELSTPDRAALHQMLLKRLNVILDPTPELLFHKSRWQALFSEGIGRLPETPRDVVRLTNALALTYPLVREEVDAVDFIAIEAVRLFVPRAYDVIRRNPHMFCEPGWRTLPPPSDRDSKKFHDGWFQELTSDGSIKESEREPLREIIGSLFPRVEKVWTQLHLASGSGQFNASHRRICDPEVFPVFFALSVPETCISRAEILSLLGLSDGALTNTLIAQSKETRPDGMSRARATLESLPHFANPLSRAQAVVLTRALMRAGDSLLHADLYKGLLMPAQEWLYADAIKAGLRAIPAPERRRELSKAMQASGALSAICLTIQFLGREHGRYSNKNEKDREPLFTEAEVDRLEALGLAKIQTAAAAKTILNDSSLYNILINWQRWQRSEPQEVAQWISAVAQDPKSLVKLLEGLVREMTVNGRVMLYIDPSWLKPLIDPSQIIEAVRSLACEQWLSRKEIRAVEGFIRSYDALEKGQDPFSWEPA